MPIALIEENRVDIYQHPTPNPTAQENVEEEITIGDLHANAIKLLYMLVRHGIASNIDETDYETLVTIYRKNQHDLVAEDLTTFNKLLLKIEFSTHIKVRLIGDEVADRGQNDFFIFKILEKLTKARVPIEILLSNHGLEFIEAYEIDTRFSPPRLDQGYNPGHANSMSNLQRLIDRGLVKREEILELVKNAYQPTLRIISYSLNEDKSKISLYSHAPVGITIIKRLAEKFGLEYNNSSALELAKTIDRINAAFQVHLQDKTLHTCYDAGKLWLAYNGVNYPETDVIEFITWNRSYVELVRPAEYNFIHGHDPNGPTEGHIYNLDNHLGKKLISDPGTYTVVYTYNPPLLEEHPDKALLRHLELIKKKEKELRDNGHNSAANCALILYNEIHISHFWLKNNRISSADFKRIGLEAIDIARESELKRHRGWGNFLFNLGLFFLGIGVFYCIAGLIHQQKTGRFSFFKPTDSIQKINALEKSLNTLCS
jgi:hypothetical protein